MIWRFYKHLCCTLVLAHATLVSGDATPIFRIEISKHIFHTDVIVVPANTIIKLIIYNRDATAEEIESHSLKFKKIIMGNSNGFVLIGPLPQGEYPFIGAFHRRTATGIIRVIKKEE